MSSWYIMDPTMLRKNFEDQIAQTDSQIKELEQNLVKAKEYRTKLTGGLETLDLLENNSEKENLEESKEN